MPRSRYLFGLSEDSTARQGTVWAGRESTSVYLSTMAPRAKRYVHLHISQHCARHHSTTRRSLQPGSSKSYQNQSMILSLVLISYTRTTSQKTKRGTRMDVSNDNGNTKSKGDVDRTPDNDYQAGPAAGRCRQIVKGLCHRRLLGVEACERCRKAT